MSMRVSCVCLFNVCLFVQRVSDCSARVCLRCTVRVVLHTFLLHPLLRLFVLVNRRCNESLKAQTNFPIEMEEKGEERKDAKVTKEDEDDHQT